MHGDHEIPDEVFKFQNLDSNQQQNEKSFRNSFQKLEVDARSMKEFENIFDSLIKCRWLILTPSCFFVTLLSWDIAGDELGWKRSFWIPLTGIGIMLIMWIIDYLVMMLLSSVT